MRPFDKIATTLATPKALALVALLLCAGCSKEPMEKGQGDELIAINLNVELNDSAAPANVPQSRSTIVGTTFSTVLGEVSDIGLFYTKEDGTTPYAPGSYNMLMRLTGTGSGVTIKYSYDNGVTFFDKLYFRANETVQLAGYYPRNTALSDVNTAKFPVDLTTPEQQDDRLYSTKQTITAATAATAVMQFKHIYSLLEFHIKQKGGDPITFTRVDVTNYSEKYLNNRGVFDLDRGWYYSLYEGNISKNYTSDNTLSENNYTIFQVVVLPMDKSDYFDGCIRVQFYDQDAFKTRMFSIKKEYIKTSSGEYEFELGRKYTFKLICNNEGDLDFDLARWDQDEDISGSVGFEPRSILDYWGDNGNSKFKLDISGFTTKNYTLLYGVGATNGAYIASDKEAYSKEMPYYRFEVAKQDAYSDYLDTKKKTWTELQGTASDRSDNICVHKYGQGWRLPRLSEMKMIGMNSVAIHLDGTAFSPISGTYWTATENNENNAFSLNVVSVSGTDRPSTITTNTPAKSDTRYSVRCIRELPSQSKPTIMVITNTSEMTLSSYNKYYGTGSTNHGFITTTSNLTFLERPYYKLEIAKADVYNGDDTKTWPTLQGTAADRSDNICMYAHGAGWRIPRFSELQMIGLNMQSMINEDLWGFTPFKSDYIWSATQKDAGTTWYLDHKNPKSPAFLDNNNKKCGIRCVKELTKQ